MDTLRFLPTRSAKSQVALWLAAALLCLGVFALRAQAGTPPTITGFSPASGPVGSTVTIDGTGFTAPFAVTFTGGVQAAGSFTLTEISVTVPFGAETGPITVTTADGSASTGVFTVGKVVAAIPTITVAVTTATATVGSGVPGVFTLTLSTAATDDLMVGYTVSGTAVNGTDYQLLKGTAKVKAGKTSKTIKIIPQGDLGGASKKAVKLVVATGTGYTVGASPVSKVKLFPAGQ